MVSKYKSNSRGYILLDSYDLSILESIINKPLPTGQVIEKIGISNKNMVLHVSRLVGKGFIKVNRLSFPNQNIKELKITSKGKSLINLFS